jgi:hypothetical protein
MIACVRTPEIFKYELDGQSEDNADHYQMYMIEDSAGEPLDISSTPTPWARQVSARSGMSSSPVFPGWP